MKQRGTIYFIQLDEKGVLLCGGDKTSQQRDITKARMIAKEWRD